ncbi:hypothetical protein [Candidatus Bealeia paramacronuclearis]|uniref:hypothetical protein n=1 Tax=Candidatus Bealeia paramacronuclearis TaxID=1921001 RepID=UPI002F266A0F
MTELLEAFQAFNEDSLSYRNEVGAVQHAYLINYYEKNEPQEGAVKKAFAFLKQGIPSLFGKTIDELKTELICIFENAFEGVEFKESAQFQNLKNYTAYLMKALPEEVRKKFSDFVKDHKISDEYRNLNQDEINENYKAENLLLQNLFNSKKLAEKSKLLSPLKF